MNQTPDISTVTVAIPVLNQLPYTANCLQYLNRAGIPDSQIVVVNNGSTDGTAEFLAGRPQIRAIHNAENRGCGFAWNQAIKIFPTGWTVVLNNDVAFTPDMLKQLVTFADAGKFDVVSPAMCEGDLDYDLTTYAGEFVRRMSAVTRRGIFFGPCFMVHRRVFDTIGLFDDDPRLGGYEDDEFWRRCRRARFRMAVTGQAFIHHFGSVTQKSMKSEQVMAKVFERRAYYRKKTGQTWIKRKLVHLRNGIRGKWWRTTEKSRFGHTLKERRLEGRWEFY